MSFTDLPIRICPYEDCLAVWTEDPAMYEDPDRCPHCGRYGDRYDYGPDRDIDVVEGTERERLFISTMSGRYLKQMAGGFIQTAGMHRKADYRR